MTDKVTAILNAICDLNDEERRELLDILWDPLIVGLRELLDNKETGRLQWHFESIMLEKKLAEAERTRQNKRPYRMVRRDAVIYVLRHEGRYTFGEIAHKLRLINAAWEVESETPKRAYQAVEKAHRKFQQFLQGEPEGKEAELALARLRCKPWLKTSDSVPPG